MNQVAWLISCEHASNAVPKEFGIKIPKEILDTHRGYDIQAKLIVEKLYKKINTLSFLSVLYLGNFSRLLIDLNRPLESKSLFSEFTRYSNKQVFLLKIHKHYWDQIEAWVFKRLQSNNNYVVHLAIHSFTPIWKGKLRNTDIGILFHPKSHIEKKLANQMRMKIKQEWPEGKIYFNRPYSGSSPCLPNYLREKFSNQFLGFEIEFKNDLNKKEISKVLKGIKNFIFDLKSIE
ncbi:MAG: N-formylglutamate amidohydrolase [Pseudomonadota bacterium]